MPFTALVANCPKTGKPLQIGDDLPMGDPRYPTYVRVTSVMDFPLTVTHCPIPECGERHTFNEADFSEQIVPGPNPESTENHPVGEFIIEMEFYKLDDGRYKVWPSVKRVTPHNQSKVHFVLEPLFTTLDAARAAALE